MTEQDRGNNLVRFENFRVQNDYTIEIGEDRVATPTSSHRDGEKHKFGKDLYGELFVLDKDIIRRDWNVQLNNLREDRGKRKERNTTEFQDRIIIAFLSAMLFFAGTSGETKERVFDAAVQPIVNICSSIQSIGEHLPFIINREEG